MHRPHGRGHFWARALLGLVLLAGVAPRAARAASPPSGSVRQVLSVRPGATCLDRDELLRQLARWLGEDPGAGRYQFVVEGSALEPRTARLYVQLEGRTVAQRVFAPGPARCSELHAALALALALAIRASAQQDLAAQPLDAEPSASEPFAQPEPALEWALSAAGLTAHGLLPALAPGLELALRRQLAEHVSLRLGAFAVAALGSELEQQDRAYDATLMVLRADACARAQLATALHGGLCGGAWGGALYAAGAGGSGSRSSVVSWFALAATTELELKLAERWSLAAALALAVPLHDVRVGVTAADGTPVAAEALPGRAWTVGLGPTYKF